MADYRKALLFSKLGHKSEYTPHSPQNALTQNSKHIPHSIDRYVQDIQKYPLLEKDNEKELIAHAQQGDLVSREKLIHANLRLVVRIAKRYFRSELSLADLIAEGNFGLMHAIRKFDLSLDNRFSTYAAWWIQHYVEAFILNQSRVIRLPVHISKTIQKIQKKEKQMSQELQGNINSPMELALQVGVSVEKLNQMKIWSDPISSIEIQTEERQGYIEMPEEDVFFEILVSENDSIDNEQTHFQVLKELIQSLSNVEKDIVFHRMGMGGFQEMTFEAIGQHMHMEKDRVRCIYQNAIKKMNKMVETHKIHNSPKHERDHVDPLKPVKTRKKSHDLL